MSGVNGYVQNFNYFKNNATVDKIRIDEQSSNFIKVTILTTGIGNAIYIPKNIYQFNKSYFIKISSEGYDEGAFLIEYRKDENVNDVTGSYNSFTDVYIDDNNPITWQTSSSYNGQIIKKGTSKSANKLCICKTYFGQPSNYANAAIWEIVILDHDATEEELTKIKDYFVKTYNYLQTLKAK